MELDGGDPRAIPWDPMPPGEVAGVFHSRGGPWWIAGGYAVDLAVGRPIRPHADTGVLVLWRDQRAIRELLGSWDLWAADPLGKLCPWQGGETLAAGAHDTWCRPRRTGPWRLQLMLDESCGNLWVSRRHPRVRRPISSLGRRRREGIPYLAPEVQLYYKAQAPRPKDERDLEAVLPVLTAQEWLLAAVHTTYGRENPWAQRLKTWVPPAVRRVER